MRIVVEITTKERLHERLLFVLVRCSSGSRPSKHRRQEVGLPRAVRGDDRRFTIRAHADNRGRLHANEEESAYRNQSHKTHQDSDDGGSVRICLTSAVHLVELWIFHLGLRLYLHKSPCLCHSRWIMRSWSVGWWRTVRSTSTATLGKLPSASAAEGAP